MAWQTKQSMCWPEERNVVDEDGKDVAFFQREEDAKRCVEAVNEVEKMRGALEAAIAGKERAEKEGPFYRHIRCSAIFVY